MKRVKAACICQTLHFMLKEETHSDGSVVIKVIKQYNSSPVVDYLNQQA